MCRQLKILIKRITPFVVSFLSALLISLLILPIRSVSTQSSTFIGFILFYILTLGLIYFYRKKLSRKQVFLSILIGGSIVQIIVRIIYFEDTIGSLPDFIITILGIVIAYFSYTFSNYGKVILFLCGIGLFTFMCIKGYDLWFHKLNFGTFTGKVEEPVHYDFEFQTNEGDTISLSRFKGKYVLIEYWNTYCGYCYGDMPKVQELFDKYKDSDNVFICSMHSRLESREGEDCSVGTTILRDRNYTYPCFSINMEDPVLEKMGVHAYPTVLIFDPAGKLIFVGNIDNARKRIYKLK